MFETFNLNVLAVATSIFRGHVDLLDFKVSNIHNLLFNRLWMFKTSKLQCFVFLYNNSLIPWRQTIEGRRRLKWNLSTTGKNDQTVGRSRWGRRNGVWDFVLQRHWELNHDPAVQQCGTAAGIMKSAKHVTSGAYKTNMAGKALPPFYVFNSSAKLWENFQLKVFEWLEGCHQGQRDLAV